MTDAVQVILLIFGGLAVSFIALNIISDSNGVIEGMKIVMKDMPERFDMIYHPTTLHIEIYLVYGYY